MPPRFSLNIDLTLGVNAPKLVVYIVNATHKLLPFFSKISLLQKALKDLFFFVFDCTSLQQGRFICQLEPFADHKSIFHHLNQKAFCALHLFPRASP